MFRHILKNGDLGFLNFVFKCLEKISFNHSLVYSVPLLCSMSYSTRLRFAVSGNEWTHCRGQIVVFPSTLIEIQSLSFYNMTCSLLTL